MDILNVVVVLSGGLLHLPWWGYVVVTLVLTHITIVAVTVFLHRNQTHRALDLHPVISHFFRLWLCLTTGMITKVWVAIHRKHHAKCETVDDPHSPQILGIGKVLFEGAELYRVAGKDVEMLKHYGKGTPDDFLEKHLYGKHDKIGVLSMLAIDIILFGPIGITMWAVQMMWIPFFAAGVINGSGHYGWGYRNRWGYRNFDRRQGKFQDHSINIVPMGLLIGGEELHNNHHEYPSSAKFSVKWWELDVGWLYIRILEILGLAHVKDINGVKVL